MIREAGAGDFAGVVRLYRELHPGDPVHEDEALYAEILRTPGLRLLVLDEGEVIATTYLNVIPNLTRAAAPYAVIENVVVAESRRGQGLGKQIMAATLQAAWDAGCYKVMLMTGSRRASTHGFYKACGFDPGEKTAYVAKRP